MSSIESEFQKMINDTKFFNNRYYNLYHPLYKYTIELIYDGHNIPDKYVIVENRILHQYPKIYKIIAKTANLRLIKKMLRLNRNPLGCNNCEYVFMGAAKTGNIKMLKWMRDNNYSDDRTATYYAAKGNQLETIKWLIDHDFGASFLAVGCAASKGYMDVANFLIDKGYNISVQQAVDKGQLEIVKYLHSIDPNAIYDIYKCDDIDVLKFLYEHDVTTYYEGYTQVDVINWLIENGYIGKYTMTSQAIVQAGSLECLRLLHSNDLLELDKGVFYKAVMTGNFEIIEWLHEIKCPFDSNATYATTSVQSPDSLAILKLLVKWGCPLADNIGCGAAFYGNLETLKYLHEIGYIMDDNTMIFAAREGHLHIIIWMRENGYMWDDEVCFASAEYYHMNVLRWLRGFDRDTCGLSSNEIEICPWDDRVCVVAINHKHIDILKFALENGGEFSERSYICACQAENVEILDYINEYLERECPNIEMRKEFNDIVYARKNNIEL